MNLLYTQTLKLFSYMYVYTQIRIYMLVKLDIDVF